MPDRDRATTSSAGDGADLRCPVCDAPAPARDAVKCATCGRRVCERCVKPYGHFMQVCDECRIGDWR